MTMEWGCVSQGTPEKQNQYEPCLQRFLIEMCSHDSVQLSYSVVSDSATPGIVARQTSLSITNYWSLLRLMSNKLVMPPNHLLFCHPLLLCLQYFPASGSFPMSQFFTSGGQSIGASASVFPMNIQD